MHDAVGGIASTDAADGRKELITNRTLLLCFVGYALLIACGTDDPSLTPLDPNTIQSADAEFMDQMALIDSELVRSEENLKDALTLGQLTRDEHLAALADASVRRTFEFMLQAVRQLQPFRIWRDQNAYVQYLADSVESGKRYEQALREGDLVTAHLHSTEIFLARARMLIGVSAVFCEGTFVGDSRALCENSEPPGGAYGAALRQFFEPLNSELLPRIEFFPSQYALWEVNSASASLLDPGLISTLRNAFEFVQGLSPPARLRQDHDRITRYLGDTLDAVLAIVGKAETQDISGTGVDFGTLARLRTEVAGLLSTEMITIVAPYFNE